MICKNCEQIVEGKYCPNCGQSASVDKVNLSSFVAELSESVFQVNRGFFYTIKELFFRPGHSIREFLEGKRKNHFKPIAYTFLLSTLYFLLSKYLGSETFVSDFVEGWSSAFEGDPEDAPEALVLNWFADNYAYTMLLLLPIYALASFLSFIRSSYNYLEHFVLNAYIIGQQAIIYALMSLLTILSKNSDPVSAITLLASLVYNVIVFWQFFKKSSGWRFMLNMILYYVLILIFFTLGIAVFFILAKLTGLQ